MMDSRLLDGPHGWCDPTVLVHWPSCTDEEHDGSRTQTTGTRSTTRGPEVPRNLRCAPTRPWPLRSPTGPLSEADAATHPVPVAHPFRTIFESLKASAAASCPGSEAEARPAPSPPTSRSRSDLVIGVVVLVNAVPSQLDAQRPDDEHVEGDEHECPERVVRHKDEVRHRREEGGRDPCEVSHGLTHDDRDADSHARHPDQQMDPSPRRDVELVGVAHSPDKNAVRGDCGDTLQDLQHPHDRQHDPGELGYPSRDRDPRRTFLALAGLGAAHGASFCRDGGPDRAVTAERDDGTGDAATSDSSETGDFGGYDAPVRKA